MKRNLNNWCFALAIVATAAAVVYQHQPQSTKPVEAPQLMRAAAPLAGEKVVDLPEDGGAYYLTLFLDSNPKADPESRKLIGWFESDSRLRGLKAQCHTKVIARGDPIFAARYANRLASPVDLPAVCLQKPSGHVVYRRHNGTMPKTATMMADEISKCFPRPKPGPEPKPTPPPATVVPSLADVGTESVEPESDPATILAILGALLAGGGGVASSWKKSNL